MRILYLGINYWPDESGIAPFATGRCEYLAECGHEVVACTGLPYYPQWRVAAAYRRRLLVREERAGVSIRRSWMYVPRKLTSLRRMVHEGTFVCSSFMRALCGPRPDLLLVVSPPLGLAASAIALGRLWRVPYVLHVTDLQPEAARLSTAERAITYLLVGDGATRVNVQARAGSLGLSNLHFLPFQPRERFFELLTRANVCLVTQRRTVADVVFPSKVLTL